MSSNFDERTEFRGYDVGIVGSGPAGLSAAAHAAELGVAHVLLESEKHASNTIYKYQKGKHVMAEPQILPLRSPMSFAAGTREEILGTWNGELEQLRGEHPLRPGGDGDHRRGRALRGAHEAGRGRSSAAGSCSPSGCRGTSASSASRARTLEGVQYQLDDPKEYSDETIVVVGAGDAGHRERAGALGAEPRDPREPQRGVHALQGGQPHPRPGRHQGRARRDPLRNLGGEGRAAGRARSPLRFNVKTPGRPGSDRVPPHHRAPGRRRRPASSWRASACKFPSTRPERRAGSSRTPTSRT